jgi:hypothetical protein
MSRPEGPLEYSACGHGKLHYLFPFVNNCERVSAFVPCLYDG